jgi:hypothetical protein
MKLKISEKVSWNGSDSSNAPDKPCSTDIEERISLQGAGTDNRIRRRLSNKLIGGSRSRRSMCLLVPWLFGQSGAAPPKPRPEHQKLGALVGTWNSEGQVSENPFGPTEKWTAKIVTEWFNGQFVVTRRVDEQGNGQWR